MRKRTITFLVSMCLSVSVSMNCMAFDNIAKGDKGNSVSEIQSNLIDKGYLTGEADGAFGAMTEEAVVRFQEDHQLNTTGIVDESTYNAIMNDTVEANSTVVESSYRGLFEKDETLLGLAEQYYMAVVEEDEKTLETIVEPWNDTVKSETFSISNKINRIDNIKTYSMDGPVDNSWLAYVCCDAWFVGLDVGVPTLLNPLLVIKIDTNLKISSDRSEYADFINEANKSEGVQALINDINKQYEELKSDSNESSSSQEVTYVCNENTKKFHYPSCDSVDQMNLDNRHEVYCDRDELIAQGYIPCGNCNP